MNHPAKYEIFPLGNDPPIHGTTPVHANAVSPRRSSLQNSSFARIDFAPIHISHAPIAFTQKRSRNRNSRIHAVVRNLRSVPSRIFATSESTLNRHKIFAFVTPWKSRNASTIQGLTSKTDIPRVTPCASRGIEPSFSHAIAAPGLSCSASPGLRFPAHFC